MKQYLENIKLILCTIVMLSGSIIQAQTCIVEGCIKDKNSGIPIPGVNISVYNTVLGTVSNQNGYFRIKEIPGDSATLVFSYLGYEKQEFRISCTKKQHLNVNMAQGTYNLNEVIISTTNNTSRADENTTSITIVNHKKIDELSTMNINEIMHREPGVSLAGAGYHKAPSIRGLARKRVVVMIDGEKISSERNPGPPGTFINPLDVQKIEILRGPYSTLFGSDAVGGVVNIISKPYEAPLSNKYVGGTISSNFQSSRMGINNAILLNSKLSNNLFLHLSAGMRKADSYKDANGDEVQGTNFSEKSISAKLTWNIAKDHRLQFTTLLSIADSIGKPAYSDSLNALHPDDDHYKYGIRYEWTDISKHLDKMRIRASFHKHEITARVYNYTTSVYGRVMNQNKVLSNNDICYQHDFSFIINPKLKILAGADFYIRDAIHIQEHKKAYIYDPEADYMSLGEQVYDGSVDTLLDNSSQSSFGLFAQSTWNINRNLILNAGFRWNTFNTNARLVTTVSNVPPYDYTLNEYTDKSKRNDAFSGNAGLSWKMARNWKLKANLGQAFRAPSTKELFVNTMTPGGMNFCNPDLAPERSRNIDLGIYHNTELNNHFELNLFYNAIEDMIILQWDENHSSGYFNNKNATLYGAEFSFVKHFNKKLLLKGNTCIVSGKEENGEVLMDVPPVQVNLESRYFFIPKKLFLSIAGKYSAIQEEVATGDIPTPAFMVFDVYGGWKINKYFKLNLSITNVLNEDYREHYQFYWVRQPGRSFNAGLQINF